MQEIGSARSQEIVDIAKRSSSEWKRPPAINGRSHWRFSGAEFPPFSRRALELAGRRPGWPFSILRCVFDMTSLGSDENTARFRIRHCSEPSTGRKAVPASGEQLKGRRNGRKSFGSLLGRIDP